MLLDNYDYCLKKVLNVIVVIFYLFLGTGVFAQELTIVQNSGSFNSGLWQVTNNASVSSQIDLTPAARTQKGTAYYKQRVYLDNDRSFSAFFQFALTNSSSYSPRTPGADGFCFVLQTTSNTAGSSGQGMGYGGVSPSVAVEFDTYQNTYPSDPDEGNVDGKTADGGYYGLGYNHASILQGGSVTNHLDYEYIDLNNDGTVDSDNPFQTGIWSVWVDYNGVSNLLEVRYVQNSTSRPASANLSYTIDLSGVFSERDVFVGFSAATGNAWSKHSITKFLFENSYASSGLSSSSSYSAATPPAAPDDQELFVTSGGTVSITAVSSSAGVDEYLWFDSSTSENPIATGSVYSTPALSENTIYYVTAVNNSTGLQSTSRAIIDITVSSNPTPNAALDPFPATHATGTDPNSTLSWSAPTAGETPTGYKLYLGTDDPPTNLINGMDLGNVTEYSSATLGASTLYYWQIVPYNDNGDCTTAPVWDFTTSDASLPVELSLFQATRKGNTVELVWTTESEIDNAGFELWRSVDQEQWQQIASYKTHCDLLGQGFSSVSQHYSFVDMQVPEGDVRYRLLDVGIDGSKGEWLETQVSQSALPKQSVLYKAYPNPFNPQTTIRYELAEKTNVQIRIFNVTGQCVASLVDQQLDAGAYSMVWSPQNMPSGLYFVHMQTQDYQTTNRVLFLK